MLDRRTVSNKEKNDDNADIELEELRCVNDIQCHCSRNYLNQLSAVYVETHIQMITEMTKDEHKCTSRVFITYRCGSPENMGRRMKKKRYEWNTCMKERKFAANPVNMSLISIGKRALTGLIMHININGKVSRISQHGHKGRTPQHALRFNEIKTALSSL